MKEEWKNVTIEEICEYVTSGGTPLASREDYYNPGTIPWLKTKEVNYCRITETERNTDIFRKNKQRNLDY